MPNQNGGQVVSTNSKFDLGEGHVNSPVSKMSMEMDVDAAHVTPQFRVPGGANRVLDFFDDTPYILRCCFLRIIRNIFCTPEHKI